MHTPVPGPSGRVAAPPLPAVCSPVAPPAWVGRPGFSAALPLRRRASRPTQGGRLAFARWLRRLLSTAPRPRPLHVRPCPLLAAASGGASMGAEGQPPAGRAWGCAPPKPAGGTAPQQPPRQHTAQGGGRRRTAAHGAGRRTAAADGGTLRLMERQTAERTAAADSGTADRPTLPTVPPNGEFGGQSAQTAPAAPCQPLPPQLHPCPPEPRKGGGGAKNGQKMDFSGLAAAVRPPDRRTRHAAQTPFWSYFVPKCLRWTAHFLPFGRCCTPL